MLIGVARLRGASGARKNVPSDLAARPENILARHESRTRHIQIYLGLTLSGRPGTCGTAPMGAKVGMHTFGSSAPLKDLMVKFGFTPDKVLAAAKEQIAQFEGHNARISQAAERSQS